jgi:branched-chain amino acid transport system substrate-binding protein
MRNEVMKASKMSVALAVAAFVAAAPAKAEDTIKVGAATSLSGWMAAFDTNTTKAAKLAVDEINAKGGLLGKKLEFVQIDTRTNPAETARAAQSLVSGGAKMIMIACDFDSGSPAALVAQKANVLAISPCGADSKLGNLTIGNNVFTMATDADGTGAIMADWAFKQKGWKKAYVLTDTFIQYDRSLCAGFLKKWKELAGADSIVLEDQFKNADVTISSQISRYQSLTEKPDVMMLCSVPPGLASAIRQIRSAGIDIPILSGTGADSSSWYSAVPGLSNFYFLNYSADAGVEDPRPDAQGFFKSYKAAYGELPNSGQGITGYAVVQAWARGVEKAKSFDTDAVRAAMETFKDEPLAGGLTTFDAKTHSSPDRPMLIMQTNDGKASAIGYYDARKSSFLTFN